MTPLPCFRATTLTILALATLAGASADARTRKPDNLVPVGEPVDCIQARNITSSTVRDDRTIDFQLGVRDIYRNTLPYSCPSLGFEQRFAYKLSTSQLCSVDTITVLTSFGSGLSMGPSCGLGKFQKMQKAGK